MKNKNGFTLMELIGVVAILGILAVIGVPAVVKILNENKLRTLKVEENNIAEAADLFKQDYCENPISSKHKKYCKPDSEDLADKTRTVLRKSGSNYYVCISDLKSLNYFVSEIEYEGKTCYGLVLFGRSKNGKYEDPTTYLDCDGVYLTYDDTACNDKNTTEYNATTCSLVKSLLPTCKGDGGEKGLAALDCVNNGNCN